MVVLLVIAIASVSGTVIPQNESIAFYVAKFGVAGYRIFSTLDIFDVYSSWWFQGLLFLLVINIVVCSLDRLPVTWKAVFSKHLSRNPSMFRNLMKKETFDTGLILETLKDACRKFASGGDGLQETPEGFFVIGEKGRWTRFGVYAVHLSIILLVVGALIGSIFGFEGYANIAEGQSVSSVQLSSGASRKLEFNLRCDDFSLSFYPNGAPREYRSSLTILEQGKPALKKDIVVNSPLRYKGINIFQSSYGLISVELTIVSNKTGKGYKENVGMGDSLKLPENLGTFVLTGFQGAMDYRGKDIGSVFYGHLISAEGKAQTILLPVSYPEFDRERKGDVTISVSGTRYYTGLQVTRDPGVWVVYAGFIMLILGCFVTFFTSHQRIFIEAVKYKGKYRVTVAGLANKNKFGMQQEVKRIAERLAKLG